MANEEEDMSAADTEALLADLERRASSSDSAASSDEGDEDIEAFLAGLEDDEVSTSKAASTKTEADPLADEFAELEKSAPPEEEAPATDAGDSDSKDKEKKKVSAVEKGESDVLRKVVTVARWSFFIVPTILALWILGAALSNWVSAGWLVALMSLITIFGTAAGLRLAIKKGSFGVWLGSLATVVMAVFLAAAPGWTGATLAKFGHWPTSAMAEAAGWPRDHGTVAANAWVGEFVGGQISKAVSAEPAEALRLGSTLLLSGEAAEASDETGKSGEDGESGETTEKGETTESGDKPADSNSAEKDELKDSVDEEEPKQGEGGAEKSDPPEADDDDSKPAAAEDPETKEIDEPAGPEGEEQKSSEKTEAKKAAAKGKETSTKPAIVP